MEARMRRIGVITGGGDCAGLNAVIRGIVVKAASLGIQVYGFRRGFDGLMDGGNYIRLGTEDVEDIMIQGGTILRTSRANPMTHRDGPRQVVNNLVKLGCKALIVIGGHDVLAYTHELIQKTGINVVFVPKSVQNGVVGTDYTFGFFSAVTYAAESIDRLHTTARSYGRCIVVETTGQKVGWVALNAGLASAAHYIMIPEVPYEINKIFDLVKRRKRNNLEYTIIVMAEGAVPKDCKNFKPKTLVRDEFGNESLTGASLWLAECIQEKTKVDSRGVILSSILRGGAPTAFDRTLGLKFGLKAVELADEKQFGMMVCLKSTEVSAIPIESVAGQIKTVPESLYRESMLFCL